VRERRVERDHDVVQGVVRFGRCIEVRVH
jgi:hypothetical protein